MKIAINAVRVSRRSGAGLETYILNFVNEFAKIVSRINTNDTEFTRIKNIEFDVYTIYPQHFPNVLPQNIKQIKIPFFKIRITNRFAQIETERKEIEKPKHKFLFFNYLKRIFNYMLYSMFYFLGDYFRFFWTQTVLPFYILKNRYNIVFSTTQLDALIFSPVDQIVVVHDTIPLIFPNYKHKQKFYIKYFLPKILKKAKSIITISENTKKDIIKYFNINAEKIFVIPYGMKFFKNDNIDSYEFKKKNNLDKFILCVSNNLPHKNLPRLIEAFKIVAEKIIDVDLLIVGYKEKKYQLEIDKKIKEYGLESRIKLLDHFKHSDLSVLYSIAYLFVFPSLYEGFGLPPLEAMACGCPVVVSNAGSLPEVCGDAAVYVDPYDPKSIAGGIIEILQNKTLRQELIKKGTEQVKKFSWESAVKIFLNTILTQY